MSERRKVKLNAKFKGDKVICAKSPEDCTWCIDNKRCELINFYYYPYEDSRECMKERSYKRVKGAMHQK